MWVGRPVSYCAAVSLWYNAERDGIQYCTLLTSGPVMHLICPHCRDPIEIVRDSSREEITCPSCYSRFNLLADETLT